MTRRARKRTGAWTRRTRLRWLVVALAAVLAMVVVGTALTAKDTLVSGATGGHDGGVVNHVARPPMRITSDGKLAP